MTVTRREVLKGVATGGLALAALGLGLYKFGSQNQTLYDVPLTTPENPQMSKIKGMVEKSDSIDVSFKLTVKTKEGETSKWESLPIAIYHIKPDIKSYSLVGVRGIFPGIYLDIMYLRKNRVTVLDIFQNYLAPAIKQGIERNKTDGIEDVGFGVQTPLRLDTTYQAEGLISSVNRVPQYIREF